MLVRNLMNVINVEKILGVIQLLLTMKGLTLESNPMNIMSVGKPSARILI